MKLLTPLSIYIIFPFFIFGESMVQPGAKVEQLADGMKFTEGPVWLPKKQKLVFSDIPSSALMQWSQKAGLSEFRKSENANILDLDGNIISCQNGARNIIRIEHRRDKKNWLRVRELSIDGMLTDYALKCAKLWQSNPLEDETQGIPGRPGQTLCARG